MRHITTLRYVDAVARAGSIRKAAEELSITSTALNRRILAIEEDLGVPVFERLPRGVRLNSAGEILVDHIRRQFSDLDRVRSQIADLSGVRRGHVSIACSQALLPYFLPEQIAAYRRAHPGVSFGVFLRDRAAAEEALVDFTADIALVFEPVRLAEFQTIRTVRQPLHAVFSTDHPLAGRKSVRLAECLSYPVALPTKSYGVRYLLETILIDSTLSMNVVIESDSFEFLRFQATTENIVSFQIPIGLPAEGAVPGMASAPIDARDMPSGTIYMGQLKNRALPIAATRFIDQLNRVLEARFG
ncbi:LysR family transcriptional regulator [Hwanghaeella sp.]|uniref:LysR family transcriptional regulator n=1 Tax=Hwanghaeella sp. TaxID=2605943 RepID=UPI003CCC224B